jgi:hypothetical protein
MLTPSDERAPGLALARRSLRTRSKRQVPRPPDARIRGTEQA